LNIKTRLRRIEAAVKQSQPDPADEAHLNYLLSILDIAYAGGGEAEMKANISALGPSSLATTQRAIKSDRDLMTGWGNRSDLMEAM
jgi:hypothetical protein